MQFSNDGANWSPAEPFAGNKQWRLSDGRGNKTGYFRFTDLLGNLSPDISVIVTYGLAAPVGGNIRSTAGLLLPSLRAPG